MSQCFVFLCHKNENKRQRHREDRQGQALALRNCLYPMRYVLDCTELVGVREQTRSPSFVVLRKLRQSDRDGGQSACVCLLETGPGSRLLEYLPRSGDWSIARQGLGQLMGALSTRSR